MPLPALEPVRLRPRAGTPWRKQSSTSSTPTRSRGIARSCRACCEAYEAYEFHVVYHQLVQYAAADLSAFYLDVLKDRLYCDATASPRRRSAQTRAPPHRLATWRCCSRPCCRSRADEVWAFLPGANGSSVHLAVFPAGEPADTARLERWATLLDARAVVTKALEAARAAKQIAASLEARVSVRGPEATLQALRAHDALSRVFPGNLANLFIVSEVRLEPGEGALAVSVEHAAGKQVRTLLDVVAPGGHARHAPGRLRALRRRAGAVVKRSLPYLLLILAVVVLDQVTKAIVVQRIELHDYVPLVDGLLSLSHVRNHGAAFGLLADCEPALPVAAASRP